MRATRRRHAIALFGAILVLSAGWPRAVAASSTELIPITGASGAMAFDPNCGVAYLGGAGFVDVVDTTSHAILQTIAVGGTAMDIALDPITGDAFVATPPNHRRVEIIDAGDMHHGSADPSGAQCQPGRRDGPRSQRVATRTVPVRPASVSTARMSSIAHRPDDSDRGK